MDRWDRRCVEFAAFRHQHGHGNVPQVTRTPAVRSKQTGKHGSSQTLLVLGFPFLFAIQDSVFLFFFFFFCNTTLCVFGLLHTTILGLLVVNPHPHVLQVYDHNPELAAWAKRQRVARTQNSLSDERLQVLASAGFEFGELGTITNEWEDMFDQLMEWLMVKV